MKHTQFVPQRAVEEQQFNLREGAEIIIATPGRLKDVIERHVLVLSQCRYVVMDEADRMVHLGFEADLTFILDKLPTEAMAGEPTATITNGGDGMDVDGGAGWDKTDKGEKGRSRVTTLFSATMPPAVERLARKYLRKPAVITIGEAGRAVDTVEQRVEFVLGDERKKCVLSFLFLAFLFLAFLVADGLVVVLVPPPVPTRPTRFGCSDAGYSLPFNFLSTDNAWSRFSTAACTPRLSSCSSIRRRRRTWWRRIYRKHR